MNLRSWIAQKIGGGSLSNPDDNALSGLYAGYYNMLFGQSISREAAMEVGTVFGAMRLIGGGMAQLPLVVKNRTNPHAADVPNDHPIEYFWNVQPCPTYSGAAMTEWILLSTMFNGNALIYCPRSVMPRVPRPGVGATTLQGMYPIEWGNVRPERVGNRNVYYLTIGPYSSLGTDKQGTIAVDQDDVLHFHGLEFDGLVGKPVISTGASRPIAVERAMTEHVGREYLYGALQKHVLQVAKPLNKEQKKEMRRQWDATYGQGTRSQHLPLIVDQGTTLETISQTSREMEINLSRDFQISDVGRALGHPGRHAEPGEQEHQLGHWRPSDYGRVFAVHAARARHPLGR